MTLLLGSRTRSDPLRWVTLKTGSGEPAAKLVMIELSRSKHVCARMGTNNWRERMVNGRRMVHREAFASQMLLLFASTCSRTACHWVTERKGGAE